jgi:hypothetical protein
MWLLVMADDAEKNDEEGNQERSDEQWYCLRTVSGHVSHLIREQDLPP